MLCKGHGQSYKLKVQFAQGVGCPAAGLNLETGQSVLSLYS